MKSDRYSILIEVFQLLRLLRRGWSTRAELAEALDVHERTIRRLIEALRDAKVPITQRRRQRTGAPNPALEYHADPLVL